VLVYWRARLRVSARPRRILEAVCQVVAQTGVPTGGGRRVLDSTVVEDAVATQDTVRQLVAAVRRVRRLIPYKVANDRVISTSIPRPVTPARPARSGVTATRATSPPNPRAGW
jgi:hypothetical protein